jgi:hypothetical protein
VSRFTIFLVCLVCLVAAAPNVHANCGEKQRGLFSCETAKGKQIEVCNFGQTVRYSFGKPEAKPEITVSVPKDKAAGTSCYACGRYISHSIDFPNGNTIYRVSWSADKLSDTGKIEGGVEVIVNGESKAIISCVSEPIIGELEGIKFTGE